jgi:hypothetical protein
MNTATNPDSRWLFPGRRAGQPMHPESLARLINKLGVHTRTGRTAAIRQHLLEMPALVVADALSYHPVTTAKSLHRPERPGAATPPATAQELATVDRRSHQSHRPDRVEDAVSSGCFGLCAASEPVPATRRRSAVNLARSRLAAFSPDMRLPLVEECAR